MRSGDPRAPEGEPDEEWPEASVCSRRALGTGPRYSEEGNALGNASVEVLRRGRGTGLG